MDLSDSETEDKSWQQSCHIFNQSEQQFLIKAELKQELENKIWQKDWNIFDRVCMENKPEDVFGTLIKQVEENRASKKPQLILEKNASPKKVAKRIQEKCPEPSSDESESSSESQEKLLNKSPKDPKENPERITRRRSNDSTRSTTEISENLQN